MDEEVKENFIVISETPLSFALYSVSTKNSPMIVYEIPKVSPLKIELYSVTGRHILTIEKGVKQPGKYFINLSVLGIPKGVYFVCMETPEFKEIKKTIIY